MRRVLELDGIRAIAIMAVLACHYPGVSAATGHLSELGWLGVDVFFALSGYLITTILLGMRNSRNPYRTFYARRAARILPSYLLVVTVIIGIARLKFHAPFGIVGPLLFLEALNKTTPRLIADVVAHPLHHWYALAPLFSRPINLPREAPSVTLSIYGQFFALWSLSIEEWFYVVWAPIVLKFPRRLVITTSIAICVLDPLLRWCIGSAGAYFDLLARFDALIYGALLAVLLEWWRTTRIPKFAFLVLAVTFATAVCTVAVIFFLNRPILGFDIRATPLFLVVGLSAVGIASSSLIGMLVLRSGGNWWFARVLRGKPFQYLGTISYTVYLVHILCGAVVFDIAQSLELRDAPALLLSLIASILSIGVARLSWLLLEHPILRWKDRIFRSAPHPSEPELT